MAKKLTQEQVLLNLEASRYGKEKQFWERILTSDYQKSVIPGDLTPSQDRNFAITHFSFSPEVTNAMKQLASGSEDKMSILFIAVVSLLIHKFSNIRRVAFAIPGLGKRGERSFDTPYLILTIEISPELTMRQFLNLVKSRYQEVYDHSFPLQIFEQLESSLFDIACSFTGEYDLKDSQKGNLMFSLGYVDNKPQGALQYNSAMYSERKVTSIITYFQHIMRLVLTNLDKTVGSVEVITPEEKHRLFNDFNNTLVPPNGSLFTDYFRNSVKRYPHKFAATDKFSEITYRELDAWSNRLSNFLVHHGIGKQDVVGVLCPRSVDFLVVILSIVKSGAVFVALDIDEPVNRLLTVLKDSGARTLITDHGAATQAAFVQRIMTETSVVNVHGIERLPYPASTPEGSWPYDLKIRSQRRERGSSDVVPGLCLLSERSPDVCTATIGPSDLCYLIFSSGSTGKPKGIRLHHLGMINHFNGMIRRLDITPDDCFAQTASCSFDIFVMQMLLPLVVGARTLFLEKSVLLDPKALSKNIAEGGVTILELVPSLIHVILSNLDEKCAAGFSSLRYLISNGEQLKTSLARKWFAHFGNVALVNAYGPAETSDDVAMLILNKADQEMSVVPIGRPLDNIHIYVVDKFDQLAPFGVEGEICISGVAVGKGYLNAPERTARAFVRNPFIDDIRDKQEAFAVMYRTGDVGTWDANGYLIFKGREDFMVKIRGVRIELAEIEASLLKYKTIANVLVTDYVHEDEKVLCAYFEEKEATDLEDLRRHLAAELPAVMVPAFLSVIDKIPYNKNGKIDRSRLPSPVRRSLPVTVNGYNTLEQKLLDVWKEVLKTDGTDIHSESDFFQLGGHSLTAIQLVAQINRQHGINLSIVQLFQHRTFGSLAGLIKGLKRKNGNDDAIEAAPVKPYYNVSSAQKRFYVHSQLYPEDLSYNCPQYYVIKGPVDAGRIEYAFMKIIETHEVFRTSFRMLDALPVQVVHAEVDFKLTFSECEEGDLRAHIAGFVTSFNLGEPGLIRAHLVRYRQDEHLLFVDTHHIISDELSDAIIIRDFLKAYAGTAVARPALQYKDYAEWQYKLLNSDQLSDHERYWMAQYETIPPKLNLPYDHLRKEGAKTEGMDFKISVTGEAYHAIRALISETGATSFAFFLAVFTVQLKRLTRNEDIVLGVPVSGRENVDTYDVVGLFLNQLPIRNKVIDRLRFLEFLETVKANCLNALRFQAYPFDTLTSKLGIQGELKETPLYNVMFAHLFKKVSAVRVTEIEIVNYHVDHKSAKTDLQLTVLEGDESFEFLLTIDSMHFEAATAVKIINDFKRVLNLVISNRNIVIADIPLPTEFQFLNRDTNLKRHELTF